MYLSVVIPSYKQAHTICAEILSIDKLLQSITSSYEIILVIDGNEDNTLEVVTKNLTLRSLQVECFSHNRGKGAALRHGMTQANGDLIAFIDAGGDIDPTSLELMIQLLKFSQGDIVIGSKRHPLSRVSYPPLRRMYSSAYQLLNQALFRLHVRDTQVGMKLFKKEVIESVLPQAATHQFAFDLELLVLAARQGFHIIDAPVRITHQFRSSVNFWAAVRVVWDTVGIFYRLSSRAPDHHVSKTINPKTSPVRNI